MHSIRRFGRLTPVLALLLAFAASCNDAANPARISADSAIPARAIVSDPRVGLVASYGFDETSGSTVTDASASGNTGTLGGGVTRSTAGRFGGALSFNGSSTVNIPDAPSLRLTTAMTLEAWVKPSSVTSDWRDVIYKANDNYYLMATSANSGRPAGGASFGTTWATTEAYGPSVLPTNTWNHLAVTYDGATIRLYVNGTQVATQAKASTFTTSSNPLQIGGNLVYGQYFTGLIDEVRVYNRALSATEIQSDMSTPVNQTSSGSIPPNSAVQLAIATRPSPTAVSGVALVAQPAIQVQDAANAAVAQAGIVVTATIASGGGTLGGATATTNASGLAAFNNLSISGSAGTRTLTFTAPSLTGVTSSNIVVSSGSAADTLAPTVAITAPTSASTYLTSATTATIGGTASDNVGVTQVTWANSRGGSGTATGTTSWSATNVALQTGDNIITVTARDAANNTKTASLTVTYATASTPSTPTKLAIATRPSPTAVSGVALVAQPAIQVQNAANVAVAQAGIVVTATIASGGGTLGGASATTNASGLAVFNNLSISGSAGTRTLTFTAPSLTGVTSSNIVVSSGSAADTQAPTVAITVPTSASTYSTSATTATIGGTASDNVGVTQVTWANSRGGSGTATGTTSWSATNVALQTGDNIITVTARDAANNTKTASLTVTYATASTPSTATKLAIVTQPSSTAQSGVAFAAQPVVRIQDGAGNAVSQSGVTITVAVATGSGTLGGALTASTNTSGVATFTGLSIAGSGAYTLAFRAVGLTSATSGTITVSGSGTATGTAPPATSTTMFFNSSEPGCNGSDSNVLLCDDFESGSWYTADCDHGGWTAVQKGWCGTIYANPITPTGAASCGSRGANNTNCAANGGIHNGGAGGVNMALHEFAGGPVTEVWARWYYKTDPGYQWGAEKHTNFTKAAGDITWFNIQFNCGTGAAMATAVPYIQILHGPSANCWSPNQGNFTLQSGRWYYFEVHTRLNSSGTVSDGLVDMWINDCGTNGVCSGTPTLRTHLTNVGFDRDQTGCETTPCKIEALWFENWANPGSTGTGYLDQIKVSKAGPIGFMP